ncbi:hypothetical protein DET60_10237 [Raoultella planticola]|nr:hypothetical protein DFO76_103645 [Raoultella planticola]TDX39664.1 hypothetical protein DET60_10237 [Raoultella planticola]
MFSGFVVFFCCLSFLRYRFSSGFVVLFRGLGFLLSGWFSSSFVVFFCGLSFLLSGWFGGGFVVFFRGLSFLFSGWFGSGFVVFFMMGGLGSGAVSCSSRSLSGAYCVSSESSRRQTHSSGNDQS